MLERLYLKRLYLFLNTSRRRKRIRASDPYRTQSNIAPSQFWELSVILYVSSQLCSRYYRCRELHSIVFDLFPGQYADSISRNATVEETERRRIVFGELHGSVWGHYILNGVLAMTERQVQDSSLKWWRWYSLYMMFS